MATVMAIAPVMVMAIDSDYAGEGIIERSGSTSSTMMACRREKNFFFLLLRVFLIIILFFFFFFQSWSKSCTVIKPCVYVCVYVLRRPKVGSKTSFGAICSFFRPKLRNLELHNL